MHGSRILLSVLLLTVFSFSKSHAQNKSVEEFVEWEVESNAVSTKEAETIQVEHFEIPLSEVEKDLAPYLPPEVSDALVFEKNGKQFVRWLINPDDSKWHLEMAKYLESKGLDSTHYKYFTGNRTASRSVILTDPRTKYSFSVKASTNSTGGHWTDKRQEFDDSFDIRFMNDFINQMNKVKKLDDVVTFLEPAAFGIRSVNQGIVVRLIDQMASGKKYYLPGFSALHSEEGARIAKLNGSDDPGQFWNEHYMKPLGKALAQLTAIVGIQYDSPHSQNFLIELDDKLKPTGKIALRDFGDIYVQEEFFKLMKRDDIIKRFATSHNTVKGHLGATVGPLHGNEPPNWMSSRLYGDWLRTFFTSFEQELSKITNVPLEKMAAVPGPATATYSYGTKDYPMFAELMLHYKRLSEAAFNEDVDSIKVAAPIFSAKAASANSCRAAFGASN